MVLWQSRSVFHELKPVLCPSLAANPGERSSPVPFFFFSFLLFCAPPRASSMTDLGSQLRCRTRRDPACSPLMPNGSLLPILCPSGLLRDKTQIFNPERKVFRLFPLSAADHPLPRPSSRRSKKNEKTGEGGRGAGHPSPPLTALTPTRSGPRKHLSLLAITVAKNCWPQQ